MRLKRDKYDIRFSNLIRERADYTCECCGVSYRENTGGLDCSHFYTRANKAVRWSTMNAAAHCCGCHNKLGGNPVIFTNWIRDYLGATGFEILNEKRQAIVKWKPWMKEEMYAHYKTELDRLKELRKQGVKGYIEITDYL